MRAYYTNTNNRVYAYDIIVNGIKVDTRRTDKPVNIAGSLPIFRKFYKSDDVRIIKVFQGVTIWLIYNLKTYVKLFTMAS